MNTNVQTKDYKQLTDMPAPEQFKPIKCCVPILCKINRNSFRAGFITTVHHKSYNKGTTHDMPNTVFKYCFLFLYNDHTSESMLIPKMLSLTF